MDWNSMILRTNPFVSCQSETFNNFLHTKTYDPFSGIEQQYGQEDTKGSVAKIIESDMTMRSYGGEKRIRRLTMHQIESLESSFEAGRKLDASRKMKLAKELGLQPRQVAVWFQNRRARWKAKKVEHLYDDLKQEYGVVYREKLKLQDEVLRLRTMLMEIIKWKKDSLSEVSYETVQSISTAIDNSMDYGEGISNSVQNPNGHNNNPFKNVNEYDSFPPPYPNWCAY